MTDATPGPGVSVREAWAQLRARGVGDLSADELEVYRLVMLPASFKRLCLRLDAEVTATARNGVAVVEALELPFGADLGEEVRRARRRAWVDRPNGEPLPRSWSVATEFRVSGRLKLVPGREFSVSGERGRFRFRHAVVTDSGERWIEAWDARGRFRSIRPERVRVVHAKQRLRPTGVPVGARRRARP